MGKIITLEYQNIQHRNGLFRYIVAEVIIMRDQQEQQAIMASIKNNLPRIYCSIIEKLYNGFIGTEFGMDKFCRTNVESNKNLTVLI